MVEGKSVDIFRDTHVRYLGYANEVGEAFRSVIPRFFVRLSYVVASGYVLADTVHKAVDVYYKKEASPGSTKHVLLSASDTVIWQSFASVIIPGVTINRICAAVRLAQRTTDRVKLKSPWVSVAVGLVSIPLIIHPIDEFVEKSMNSTYRKWTGYSPVQSLD